MSSPYTTTAKFILGAAFVAFCAVLGFDAFGVGNLSRLFVTNVAEWSAITILFVALLVLPQARRRDALRDPAVRTSTVQVVNRDNGLRAIRIGSILLVFSIVLFFGASSLGDGLPRGVWDALSFVDTASLFFGGLCLAAGLRARLIAKQ